MSEGKWGWGYDRIGRDKGGGEAGMRVTQAVVPPPVVQGGWASTSDKGQDNSRIHSDRFSKHCTRKAFSSKSATDSKITRPHPNTLWDRERERDVGEGVGGEERG